jgi:hypothetical protein
MCTLILTWSRIFDNKRGNRLYLDPGATQQIILKPKCDFWQIQCLNLCKDIIYRVWNGQVYDEVKQQDIPHVTSGRSAGRVGAHKDLRSCQTGRRKGRFIMLVLRIMPNYESFPLKVSRSRYMRHYSSHFFSFELSLTLTISFLYGKC